MTSSVMELSILKLTSPRKRLGQSARFSFDTDPVQSFGMSNISSPVGKNTESPTWTESNRMMVDDELFTIFEQHRAAIPFKWEAIPGTRIDQVRGVDSLSSKDGMSDSDQDDSSASSPTFSLSPSSSTNSSVSSRQEEDNSIHPASFTTPTKDNGRVPTLSDSRKVADEAGKGKVLALKPPPGMHSIKQLLTLESESRSITPFGFNSRPVSGLNSSSSITPNKSNYGRSFRKDGILALPFLSAPKEHVEVTPTPVLGFEEWYKVVEEQEKLEKQEQQETAVIKSSHHRTMSMPRLPFSFRKKPTAEKENGNDFVDADSIFNEDFGKKGGLRERRTLSSLSSGTLADLQAQNFFLDDDADFPDTQMETRTADSPKSIAEHDVGEEVDASGKRPQVGTPNETPNETRKREPLIRFGRFFNSNTAGQKPNHRPARLSSVSPASPPPLARSQSELQLRKTAHHKQVSKITASPLLKMCLSNPIGQALLKNVKQLRSFEFRTSRALTAK